MTKIETKKESTKQKTMVRDKFFKCPACNENIRVEIGISACPECGRKLTSDK